jgi:hypothetical protein
MIRAGWSVPDWSSGAIRFLNQESDFERHHVISAAFLSFPWLKNEFRERWCHFQLGLVICKAIWSFCNVKPVHVHRKFKKSKIQKLAGFQLNKKRVETVEFSGASTLV